MRRLTPELICHSSFSVLISDTTAFESRELDFNLARRSGIIINQVVSQIAPAPGASDHLQIAIQELDFDPDNTQPLWTGSVADHVEYDSSRLIKHHVETSINNTAGLAVYGACQMIKDWHAYPIELRPISITSMRHHVACLAVNADAADFLLSIYYYIAELTLEELGILNASRR